MTKTTQEYKIHPRGALYLLQEIEDESVDLVATDPPYNTDYKTNRRISKNKKNNLVTIKKEHPFTTPIKNDSNNEMLIKNVIKEIYRILKPDTAFYCFCSPDTVEMFKSEINKYFTIKNIIIWVKNSHTAGDLEAQYGKQYEMIIYANKGRRKLNGKRITDVWFFDRVPPTQTVHQNQKPLKLIEQILRISSNEGDIVVDTFLGSGTLLEAGLNTNRNCLGFDISDEWEEHYKKRLMSDNSKLTDTWGCCRPQK